MQANYPKKLSVGPMWRGWSFFILAFCLCGCVAFHKSARVAQVKAQKNTYTARYDISLLGVKRPADAILTYGLPKIEKIIENDIKRYSFEDKLVRLTWVPCVYNFSFIAYNKSGHPLEIIWKEAAYIDKDGYRHKLMHSGIEHIERNDPQPVSLAVRKGYISDLIVPENNIEWVSEYFNGRWQTRPLLPVTKETDHRGGRNFDQQLNKTYRGKRFQVVLPFKIKGKTQEYVFTFRIDDVEVWTRGHVLGMLP